MEVPEGMKLSDTPYSADSFTLGVVPDFDLSIISTEYDTIQERLNEIKETHKEITEEIEEETQAISDQSSKIPDWAGHSDYVRERMAATGTTTLGDMMSLGSSTPETHDNVVTSTRTIEQSAGGSISTSLLDVSRSGFNTVSQKLDKVVDAVNGININVPTGSRRTGTSPGDVIANAKENKLGAGQVRLRY
jgi:septation ring formation regulator EzrA